MTTHSRQNFNTILVLVVFIHMVFLFFSFQLQEKSKKDIASHEGKGTTTAPIKVKFVKVKKFLSDNMKQIVDSEDPEVFKRPENAKYLSDKNRAFDRQSVAKTVAPFQKSARIRKGGDGSEGNQKFKNLKLSDLGQRIEKHPLASAAKEYARAGTLKAISDHGASVSSTSDYIEGVPLGDLTHLNTQEFQYYGFYHRIKLKLEQFWGRSIHEKAEILFKSGRRIATDNSVITSLRVTLDELGEIIAISVTGPSGVRELDDAAIESFNQAGPFPNPPKGMMVDGKAIIEWGFVVNS